MSSRELSKLEIFPTQVACTFPFTVESDYLGILGLGGKLIEEPYNEDDKELLSTLVNNLIFALRTAISRDLSNFYQRATALNVILGSQAHTGLIIARSPKMRKVEEEIAVLSENPEPILITGEQGTGGAFAFLLRSYLPRILSPNPDSDPAVISRLAFALLVLA